eukprot:7387916-Prymnesium_polylepis.1
MLSRRSTSFARISCLPVAPVTPPGSLKSSDAPNLGCFGGGGTDGTFNAGSPISARSRRSTSSSIPWSQAGAAACGAVRAVEFVATRAPEGSRGGEVRGWMLKPLTSTGGTLDTFLPIFFSSSFKSHISFLVKGTMPSLAQPRLTRSTEKASSHGSFAAARVCASESVAAAISSARVGSRPSAAALARAA